MENLDTDMHTGKTLLKIKAEIRMMLLHQSLPTNHEKLGSRLRIDSLSQLTEGTNPPDSCISYIHML